VVHDKYDKTSIDSIVKHAKLLTGKSLSDLVTLPPNAEKTGSRGKLGNLVEQFFFDLPVTTSGIDFRDAKLELKTTGLLKRASGGYKAKERLVLTMINYKNIVSETWESSIFLEKCKLMLILFYLYENDVSPADYKFVLDPLLYEIEKHDLQIIKRDWEIIREKVLNGKAHEISEGDTFYLGACRKGSGGPGEKPREQPFSDVRAKSRAFSFKPSYVNTLIAGDDVAGRNIEVSDTKSFEDATSEKFAKYVGMSIQDISQHVGYEKSSVNHKGFLKDLSTRILAGGGNKVPELEKAGIEMKTVRLSKSGTPRESMSFPGFKFDEILKQDWEQSSFFEKLESKFLFVVFREDTDGVERLVKVQYWNMPFSDRIEAKRVWEDTKKRVGKDARNLPKISESQVAHVRPKARNSSDTLLSPQGHNVVKQCFWLNASYVKQALGEG
jgi:DNA mismatch repair protein MutH